MPQIARVHPHDALIRYRLFEMALATHDARDPAGSLAELDRVLAEIDGIAGQGPLWKYGKAVRLKLEAGGKDKPELFDAAMNYADQARSMRLAWSRPYVLEGGDLPPARQRRRGVGELSAGLGHRGSRSAIHPPPAADALRAARYQDAEQVIRRLESSQTQLTPGNQTGGGTDPGRLG